MAGPKTPTGPRKGAPPGQTHTREAGAFAVTSGRVASPQRIVVYGPGGIGKTTLSALAPGAIVLDVEEGSRAVDCQRIGGIETFDDLLGVLNSDILDGYETVVIDSATKVEELSVQHTLATVLHPDKKVHVDSVEAYGYGKGYSFVYDTFLLFLQALDAQVRKGRNVILVAHDCVEGVPNPLGDDWIRYEPHLQRPKSGKASIRNRVVQWADHVLFLSYDLIVEEGKARGAGTRTVYTAERPSHIAKSRTIADNLTFDDATDASTWAAILGDK
jgi:hypothetical protein